MRCQIAPPSQFTRVAMVMSFTFMMPGGQRDIIVCAVEVDGLAVDSGNISRRTGRNAVVETARVVHIVFKPKNSDYIRAQRDGDVQRGIIADWRRVGDADGKTVRTDIRRARRAAE